MDASRHDNAVKTVVTTPKSNALHGDVKWDPIVRALNRVGYQGPLSIEWEDSGMDRLHGAPLALEYARKHVYDLPEAAFDSHFDNR